MGSSSVRQRSHASGGSIYSKMKDKSLSFHEVFDVYAFRIVVGKVDTCYRVLGALHSLYPPIPGRFKDYIAIPKSNGYQSLHTTLASPYGVPIEVQIRTDEMDQMADAGIAAHWLYKTGKAQQQTSKWITGLLDLQKKAGNTKEFLESVKVDLFPAEVYVFTPHGKIIVLPRGSTSVDFAYAVHTDIGNTCVAAKINRQFVPLQTQLRNGNTIEIITDKHAVPSPAWLNFIATAKARYSIRHHLKQLQRRKARKLGKGLLDKALHEYNLTWKTLSPERLTSLLEELQLNSEEELFEDVGLGNRMAPLVARQLTPLIADTDGENIGPRNRGVRPIGIKSNESIVLHLAKCCRPVPGDRIQGIATAGRGIIAGRQAPDPVS